MRRNHASLLLDSSHTILKVLVMSRCLNRRQFVQTTTGTAVALGSAMQSHGRPSPANRIRLGLIGCGGRGRELLSVFLQFPDVEIPVVSDVIEPRMAEAAKWIEAVQQQRKVEQVVEHERILERNDIDAVIIATTQHWHGRPFIQAAQAGKHIYVEKPLSHTVTEGAAMVKAAEKYPIVAVMGTQQRGYAHYQTALEIIRSGRLGTVPLVECWNYHDTGSRVGRAADENAPPGYHWDRWLGPAPKVPFNRSRLNNSWWFAYAGGMMTNWAIHHIDIILAAMQSESPAAVNCSGGKFVVEDLADTPDTIEASWEFPEFVMQYRYRGFNNFHAVASRPHHHGICFYGDKATMVLDRSGYEIWEEKNPARSVEKVSNPRYYRDGKPGNEVDGPWQQLFLKSIRQGTSPLDLRQSHQATVCCHLANISYLCGKKVHWDAEQQSIDGDAEAAALLDRSRRPGYELPDV
jgi:predicted dehydrogenase